MIELESVVDATSLPTTPNGWFEYGYTAIADGRLALVRTRMDVHAEHMRWWKAVNGGDRSRTYPKVWDGDIRLSIFDGIDETDVVTLPSGAHPLVDRMSDGRWLVVAGRAAEKEKNGRIYTADGQKEHAITLGDGIENLLCSADGTIWVGYFDEGVFGGPNQDGSWPVSSGGIVQFDSSGTVLWSFNEQVHGDHSIADSYAMTLSGSDVWSCSYTDFPISQIRSGKAKFWANSVAGAKAIAVKDGIVVLGGGYSEDANRIAIVKLDGNDSRKIGTLHYTPSKPGAAGLLQGRGSTLHIVSDGAWFRLPVYKAAQATGEGYHT